MPQLGRISWLSKSNPDADLTLITDKLWSMVMNKTRQVVPALKVKQWLDIWEEYEYDSHKHRTHPQDHFYLFSLN